MNPSTAKSTQPKPVTPSFQISDTSHISVLRDLCSFLSDNSLVTTTRPPLPTRYPQFVGAQEAAKRAATVTEFLSAGVVLVSPGVAVLSDVVLQEGKMLVSPTPGLRKEKVFQQLVMNEDVEETLEGRREPKYLRLEVEDDLKIDLLVVGSMLVDKMGRRMGKKREQVGLEFVLGGLSGQKMVVITLVHDCQVVEEVPETMFSAQDVPVDIIVTPTRVIRVKNRLPKPDTIVWSSVTSNMMENIPMLEALRKRDKEDGKAVELAVRSREESKKEFGDRSGRIREMDMGCKVKFTPLPRELKYSKLKEVLREKVEPGFKVGVLKLGMATVFFKETSDEIIGKLKGLSIDDKKVEIEAMELVKREKKDDRVGVVVEAAVTKKKADMKSKFKFENIGDAKSADLKEALNQRNVHFGFLKIFKKSEIAIVLFEEEVSDVVTKLKGLAFGESLVELISLELGEKKERSVEPPKMKQEGRSWRTSYKELKLKEMKSKFKFKNLGDVRVSTFKGILRESKVDPGFIVVYKKFGVAIVMFKELSAEMMRKLKGLKVEEKKVEFEEIELEDRKPTRFKKISVSDKKAKVAEESLSGRKSSFLRKRTFSQKMIDQGLSGMFIGSLPRDVTEEEIKEAVHKKDVNAAHIELFGRKGFAFAYFEKKPQDLVNKLKDLTVKERICKVEVMRFPPRTVKPGGESMEQPKVEGIVAKEDKLRMVKNSRSSSEDKQRRYKKTSSSEDEKRRSKKVSSEDEKSRYKKISSSEDEVLKKKNVSSIDAKVPKVFTTNVPNEANKTGNKMKSGKKPRGT